MIKTLFITVLFVFSLTASGFDLVDLSGQKLRTRGVKKDIILYFWASWCSECKAKIKKNFSHVDKKKYKIILVNMDKNPKKAALFINKYGNGLKVYRDHNKTYEKRFHISALPFWAHYKRKGRKWMLVKSKVGGFDL